MARQPGLALLTPTERRILRLIATGQSSKEISDALFVHYRTVENHRVNIAQKLGLNADIKGVTVTDIDRNSPAAGFGLQPRDIVREVNGEEIDTAETLKQVAEAPSRWWRFTVERDGQLLRQTLRY